MPPTKEFVTKLAKRSMEEIKAIRKLVDDVKDRETLPDVFNIASDKLPIISEALDEFKKYLESDDFNSSTTDTYKTFKDCSTDAEKLHEVFDAVISSDGASRSETYIDSVEKSSGGVPVEGLLKTMLEGLQQYLQTLPEHFSREENVRGISSRIAKALEEITNMKPSIVEKSPNFTYTFNSKGKQYNNTGSGSQYNADTQNIGQRQA